MAEKKGKYPSTLTVDSFSSTKKLAGSDMKVDVDKLSEYDPYEHRQVEHANSTMGTAAHLIKGSLGTGILAMPNAFKNAGFLFGFLGSIVIGIISTYSLHMLVKASYDICKKTRTPMLGFSETAQAIFEDGPKSLRKFGIQAKIVVDVALVATCYFTCCVYVVFVAGSIEQLIDHYCPDLGWSTITCMAVLLPFLVVVSQIRILKFLVPFSTIANALFVVSLGMTLYYIFDGGFTVEGKTLATSSFSGIALFCSTLVFAMESVGVVMPVENAMKHPQHFVGCPGVMSISMTIVVSLYIVIGFFGYLKYGDETQSSITYSLPTKDILAQVVKILVAVAIFLTYTLQFYIAYDIIWRALVPRISNRFHNLAQVTFRTVLVAISVGIGMLIPNLESIIGLVGAICLSMLGIFIPAFLNTILLWNDLGTFKWKLWKNSILMAFSVFTLVSGTYESIKGLLEG